MFSDMTMIGSSSLLTNKHDVSDINKLHLFNNKNVTLQQNDVT